MHIILGAIGSIVTILWLLHRLAEMGIDLGGLNPWLWRRRRNFKRAYEANPVFGIESPMEVTALLITATAKADGDMSSEEKQEILRIFESEFRLSEREASELLTASAHLLGRGEEVRDQLEAVLAPSLGRFSAEQSESAIALLHRIAAVSDSPTASQRELVSQVEAQLGVNSEPVGKWS